MTSTRRDSGSESGTTTKVDTDSTAAAPETDFKRLLKATGRLRGDLVSISNPTSAGRLHNRIYAPADAVRVVAEKLSGHDCWYSAAVLHKRVAESGFRAAAPRRTCARSARSTPTSTTNPAR